MLLASSSDPNELSNSVTFRFARASVLYPYERLRRQNGGRIHDLDIDGRDLHRNRTALDRHTGLLPRRRPVGRQLHLWLEYRGAAGLGSF